MKRYRICVVGAGWSGLAAAIHAVQAGHQVTVLEASRSLGGRARTLPASADALMPDGSTATLEDPVSVAPGPQGLGLVPTMFTSDPQETITLNSNSVALYARTDDSVRMKYIEAVTRIKVPEKKLILG